MQEAPRRLGLIREGGAEVSQDDSVVGSQRSSRPQEHGPGKGHRQGKLD